MVSAQLSFGQFEILGGANYAFVRHQYLPNAQPIFASQWGFGITVNPKRDWQKISVTSNVVLTTKGYEQQLNQDYEFRLLYVGLQVILNYNVSKAVALQGGVELSGLESSSFYNSIDNYRSNDVGILVGVVFFSEKQLSFFAQSTLGLLPLIDYYDIDAAGNFNGRIRDVRNTCLTVGLKFKLIKRKFYVS